MIPITISKVEHKIKSIDELTTKEFIEVSRIKDVNHIKYLVWATGVDYLEAFTSRISDSVIDQIGVIPDTTKLPVPKKVLGKFIARHDISMIGQRFMIETTKKHKGYDLLVFIVAVALTKSADFEEIENFMQQLYKEPFIEVLPTGSFFFAKFTEWQKYRSKLFNENKAIDKDVAIKQQAGVDRLNQYANYIEVITISELLNVSFESTLYEDDVFCTKLLLYNLEKANFERKYSELKAKQNKK